MKQVMEVYCNNLKYMCVCEEYLILGKHLTVYRVTVIVESVTC